MSGGHWDYQNDGAAREIFGWGMTVDYGDDGFAQSVVARKLNPLEDKQLSELCWDMFCLLHSYDWYICGDTDRDTYLADVKQFKQKWLKASEQEMVRREIEKSLAEAREDLCRIFGVEEVADAEI